MNEKKSLNIKKSIESGNAKKEVLKGQISSIDEKMARLVEQKKNLTKHISEIDHYIGTMQKLLEEGVSS